MLSPICWYEGRALAALEVTFARKITSLAVLGMRRVAPWLPGWRRELLLLADVVLPNSQSEANQLARLFGVPGERLGASYPTACCPPSAPPAPNYSSGASATSRSFCMSGESSRAKTCWDWFARFERWAFPWWRSASLRRAGTPISAGAAARGAASWRWLGRVDHHDPILGSAYAAAKVFALPSWFETPGLAALEAALAGCPVVITPHGSTRDYFGDLVEYARPDRGAEIRRALTNSWNNGSDPRLARLVATHFLWPKVAQTTAEVYDQVAPNPQPVRVGRYRYSKLRWRLLVHALDGVGALAMAIVRRFRRPQVALYPRKILVVQLDHLGDAVLSTPLVAELKAAYPDASIDVLASPSNYEVFEAVPHVDHVRVAERTWFERRPDRFSLLSAVWSLGRSLRGAGYDLGIDVRGDVLSILVLALAGVPRRVGWAMGGGAFLLTDVEPWVPDRHEVQSRLALLSRLGITPDAGVRVDVPVSDRDRIAIARRLAEAWPRKSARRAESYARTPRRGYSGSLRETREHASELLRVLR